MDLTLNVPARNLAGLEARVNEVNKRARRLGLPEVTLTPNGETFTETRFVSVLFEGDHVDRGEERRVTFHPMYLTGEPVHLEGWSFVATLHHEGAGQTLASTVPGEVIPEAWQWATNRCDHCGHNRRRNATYLLRHDENGDDLKQVGRSCLKDFFPQSKRNPETMARWAECLTIFHEAVKGCEEMGWGSGGEDPTEDLEEFLTVVALVMRHEGWVSKGKAKDDERLIPTVTYVGNYLYPSPEVKEWRDNLGKPTDEDRELAGQTIAWAEGKLVGEGLKLSDYEHNLGVVVQIGYVRPRHWGLAASMVSTYERAVGRERARKEEREALLPSRRIGAAKDRVRLHDVEVVFTKLMPDRGWGPSLLVKMRHHGTEGEANDLVWFSSREPDPEKGQIIHLKATVKGHETYNGREQTKLNRVTWRVRGEDDAEVNKGKVAYDDYDTEAPEEEF